MRKQILVKTCKHLLSEAERVEMGDLEFLFAALMAVITAVNRMARDYYKK